MTNAHQKTMLITGTSRGLGAYLKNRYLGLGHVVAGFSRTEAPSEDNYFHYTVDVSDEQSLVKAFMSVKKDLGGLDVLINNAGVFSANHALLTPLESFMDIMRINTGGAFAASREAAKIMRKKNFGRIVNITSVAVPLELEGQSAYGASKAALNSITRMLAKEYAPMGITVNAVGASVLEGGMAEKLSEKTVTEVTNRLAIKKQASYEDAAHAVDFFIQPESSMITGQILYLGGI